MSNKNSLTEALLIANGFQKGVKANGLTQFSKRIPGTISDFIIMKEENGLFYAPQIQPENKMIALSGQDNLLSMKEVNFYYQRAIKELQG